MKTIKIFLAAVAGVSGAALIGAGIYGFIFNLATWGAPILLGGLGLVIARGMLD